ncbi:MAG TPA: site-specific integrase [Magnetospirillum sp.]|nr:site-specific integrase [Magnetospirillum sp.]
MATIRKRALPSGKVVYQCDYRDQNGKRRAKQFDRKKDADAFLVTARAEVRDGSYIHDAESITIKKAADLWLEECDARQAAGRQMERSTLTGYKIHVNKHICAEETGIGALKLSRITRLDVIRFRDRLLAGGLSEPTTRKVLTSLKQLLDHAQTLQYISSNPVDGVKILRTSRVASKITIPSKEGVRAMIAAASEDFRAHLIVAALCGLRAGESRGLRWEDVDFTKGYVHVQQRADRFGEIGEPKSAAGVRSVPMGPMVANALKRWKLRCPKGEMGLVFPNSKGLLLHYSNMWERDFQPLFDALDAKHEENPIANPKVARFRWHDFRHFAISLWIEQGFPPKAIMEFAGHANINLTFARYGHLFPSPDHHTGMAEVEKRVFGGA